MAIKKKYVNEMFGIVLVLSALLSAASAVDCNGKSFQCVNSTHFMICVDLGGGISQAIDNFFIACPPPTVCQGTNHFECEFPAPTTPATTLSNVISETSLPWEEVVTASSPGNATKEFSENYINTEKITTTAEYSTTTDATVDLTLAAEIATTAIETKQTVNESVNTTEYVPSVVAVDITTAVIENVRQTTNKTKNLTETDPVVVHDITATAVETTTENIIITDTIAADIQYIAPSATEQVAPTINENRNMTETVPTGIENVTQTTTESKNLKETDPLVVDDITATAVETTTDNIIKTDTIAVEIKYIAPSATELVAQSINENLFTTETVPISVNNVTQTMNETKNTAETGHVVVDDITATALETTTDNIIITDTVAAEIDYIAPSATEKVAPTINESRNMTETVGVENVTQTTTESKNLKETDPLVVDDITATAVETTTNNIIKTDTIAVEIKYIAPSATELLAQTINENLFTTETVPIIVNNVTQTMNETKNTAETGHVVVDDITATALETTTDNIIITDTVAAEIDYIAPSATEQVAPTINKNRNMTETVPTGVENVTQTKTESKNLKETDPLVVDDITATAVQTTTDKIIKTDTIAAEIDYMAPTFFTTETVPTSVNKNITTTIIETVTQTTAESGNLTQTEHVETYEMTATTIETTTDSIYIITDSLGIELGYIEPTDTEQVKQTKNDNLLELETVQSNTEPPQVTILFQNVSVINNTLKEPSTEHKFSLTNITISNLDKVTDLKTKNKTKTEKSDSAVQNNLPVQTTAKVNTIVETTTENVEYLTTISVDRSTDDYTTVSSLDNKFKEHFKSERVNVSEPSKPLTSFEGSVRSNASIVINKQAAANEIENKEKQMPTINDPVVPNSIVTSRNRTQEVKNIIDARVVASSINSTTSLHEEYFPEVTFTTDVSPVYAHDTKENVLHTSINKSLHENTTVPNVTTTLNPADTTVLGGTETLGNGASTEQPTTLIQEIFTTDTNKNIVTENIIPPSHAVNLETINMDTLLTTVSNAQPMPPTFEDNMKFEITLPVTENILSTVNNGASTNGSVTVQSVNMDTLVTEDVDIPTTISNNQPISPDFEEVMKAEQSLGNGAPATEDIVITVNNKIESNIFMRPHPKDLDTITTDATFMATTVSYGQALAFGDITTGFPLLATENILSSVTNGPSTDVFMTSNPVNAEIINTEAMYIPKTISNAQPITPTFEDNITTDVLLSPTENILSSVNNGASTNGLATAQAVNVDTINTDALYIPTTITSDPPLAPAFEDNMNTYVPLPATVNVVASVNNGVSTNGITTSQAVNVDSINAEAMYISTTISNAQPITPTFEEQITTNVSLAAIDNILSSVNNGTDRGGLKTAQAVNVDTINAEAIPTKMTNVSPVVPAFEENIMTKVSIAATENILSSEMNGIDIKGLTTAHAVNVDNKNTDTMDIPITITNTPLIAPAFENNNTRTDVPLPANGNMVSSVNNGATTNGLMTTQAVNVDIIDTDTMYITTTINNAPPMATTFGDNTRTETTLSAPKKIIFPKNNEDSANGFMIANPMDLEQITQKAGFETIVQLTPDKYVVPSKHVVVSNEKTTSPVYGDIITKTSGALVPVIIKESPNTIIQKTQIILNSSRDIGVKLDAIESDVNENYNDNQMTTINTNNMYEIGEQHIVNNIPNLTVDSGVDESISHISQTGARNTENSLFPNAQNNQPEVTSAINEVTANVKPTAENINEQAPVNVTFSQTGASPISINGNMEKATTTKSITTSGFDSAFDISNQNWTSQQGESNTKQATNNLQQSIVEHNGQAHNIIWNPLANQVFNNPNQNPESIVTSSVTNINDNTNDRNAATLNSQAEIPVTIDLFNLKTGHFATAGIDFLSVPTTLPARTSDADITIRNNTKNTYKPIDNSLKPPSGSTVVETDNNTPRKSGSNAVISLENQEHMKAKSPQDSSIASISITSDIKPDMTSSIIKDDNSDSPTVEHNNLPSQSITSQFELPTNTHSFSEAASIGTPMEGNKVIKEDDTINKTVMLDLLPLPLNNIKFGAHTTNKPVLMDLKSNSQADNTVIITESYKSETLKPIFAEIGIQESGNGGDITTVPRIREPTFNFQMRITDKTSGTATVSSATFNSQTRVIDGSDLVSQHSQQVEKIPNKMASAPNNTHVVPKPSGSAFITNNPDNLHSPNSSNYVNTGIITLESVSESNYESPKSENIMPQVSVIGYQKNNTTVVTDLRFASHNNSFSTEKAPPNSIGSDHMQTQQNNPSTNNTSSIFTPAQKISTSTARTTSQMATSNPISHIKKNLTKQVPTVAAHTFSCIYGIRGRYSDKGDCRKFYICIGNNEPIVGYCPENTVFSDLKKLCTKNMSHCIRENQFKCPSVGRYSDFMKNNVYYICVTHNNNLYRFKFQCEKGYILDKTTVKCIETKEIESNESVSISSDNSSQTSSSAINSSTSSKSISNNISTSKNSNKDNDSSSKKDNSSKSKKNNDAEDTSEKSEGKDEDDDDEVFKCKKEGKFPIRNECRRYYLCKKSRRSQYRRKIKKCDSDQVFNKNKKRCVDDDSYEC